MVCIAFHNMYIFKSCKPRWKLHVGNLGLFKKHMKRSEDTTESNLNRVKIINWL